MHEGPMAAPGTPEPSCVAPGGLSSGRTRTASWSRFAWDAHPAPGLTSLTEDYRASYCIDVARMRSDHGSGGRWHGLPVTSAIPPVRAHAVRRLSVGRVLRYPGICALSVGGGVAEQLVQLGGHHELPRGAELGGGAVLSSPKHERRLRCRRHREPPDRERWL